MNTPKSSKPKLPGQRSLDSFFRPSSQIGAPAASSQQKDHNPHRNVQTPPKPPVYTPRSSSFAVVLAPSPGLRESHYSQPDELEDEGTPPPANLISDLSPQFRRLAAQAQAAKPISLSRPSAVYDERANEADELAQPRAKLQSRGEQLSPPKKKRGRPKGYRPSLVASAARSAESHKAAANEGAKRRGAEKPAGSYYAGPKRRGRPPKPPPPKPREIYQSLNPKFQRFICEWEGCPAELHNLETLQKHVVVVHARQQAASGQFYCRWKGCEAAPGTPVRLFTTAEELRQHVDEVHMSSQQWHAGDGPRITHRGATKGKEPDQDGTLPGYLFQGGEQVTPSIWDQREEDIQTHRDRKRKLKNLLALRDMNAPDEEEYFQAGERDEES